HHRAPSLARAPPVVAGSAGVRAPRPGLPGIAAAVTAPTPGLARRAVRGTAWAAAGAYSSFAVTLVLNLALARLLSPATFGAYALAGATCDVVFLLAGLSFGQAIVQLHGQAEKLRGTVLLLSLALAGLLALVALAALPFLRAGLGDDAAAAFLPI